MKEKYKVLVYGVYPLAYGDCNKPLLFDSEEEADLVMAVNYPHIYDYKVVRV